MKNKQFILKGTQKQLRYKCHKCGKVVIKKPKKCECKNQSWRIYTMEELKDEIKGY